SCGNAGRLPDSTFRGQHNRTVPSDVAETFSLCPKWCPRPSETHPSPANQITKNPLAMSATYRGAFARFEAYEARGPPRVDVGILIAFRCTPAAPVIVGTCERQLPDCCRSWTERSLRAARPSPPVRVRPIYRPSIFPQFFPGPYGGHSGGARGTWAVPLRPRLGHAGGRIEA